MSKSRLIGMSVLLAGCVSAIPVWSQQTANGGHSRSNFDKCFDVIGSSSGIYPPLLRAIAKVESSNNPKATNREHVGRTGSYDIGLMQINSRWLGTLQKFGISEKDLFEPCTSIEVGAWILSDLFRRHGDSWEAVGAYNAACSTLKGDACRAARDKYIGKVRRALRHSTQKLNADEVSGKSMIAGSFSKEPLIQSIHFSN